MIKTITLLVASNIFMTYAWYGHLTKTEWPLWKAIVVSWLIAFAEYCLMVPANRYGFKQGINPYWLKTIQEVITLVVFCAFATIYLKQPFKWNYVVSFAFLSGAVYFMFKK